MEETPAVRYVVFDVETPNHRNDRISAIGISVVEDGRITEEFFTLVNPETRFDVFNIQLTGISEEKTKNAPAFPELWKRIRPLMDQGILVAHNAVFDLGVLKRCLMDYHIAWRPSVQYVCTVQMGRRLLPGMKHNLNILCGYYGISLNHHQADSDSHACAEILLRYVADGADVHSFLSVFQLRSGGYIPSDSRGEENAQANPGNCSSGLGRYERQDITVDTRKILSCVYRTGQRYGMTVIADVLKGSDNPRYERLGLTKQSTFGIMRDQSVREIRTIIAELVRQGYLRFSDGEYPVLRFTEKSREGLFGKQAIEMRKPVRQS